MLERRENSLEMTAADLSSAYLHEVRHEMGHADPDAATDIILFGNLLEHEVEKRQWVKDRTPKEWIQQVFRDSAVFHGIDELIWGEFLVCIYKDPITNMISALFIDKLGVTHFNPVDITNKSQFYPAIENLTDNDKDSNVKKSIAVSLLRKYAQLSSKDVSRLQPDGLRFNYDPTHAGDLASRCKLVESCAPETMGTRILSQGSLQRRCNKSILLDVIYERKESLTEINNKLVFHLGEQLEQLFNPLTEYSPEQTEYTYKPPDYDPMSHRTSSKVVSIIDELLQLQTNFTFSLVEFLQGFLISLRIKVLNEQIKDLSTVKLNRLFPPTIDEVTRINCIFLDSLKAATPFGALEILKACSATIPYFYKAYTRHEAATKNFVKNFKLFLKSFEYCIPRDNGYSNMKIESIINGPQEKLVKLKLIIDRLYRTEEWPPNEQEEAKSNFDNIALAIDSFGKMKSPLSSYNTRVFTPSGKILTELAKGWPEELQYKWLKRRVVGVFDVVGNDENKERQVLVIFSDYIVFLEVVNGSQYYSGTNNNKPKIADILMNSLINEVPLPTRIPKLKVHNYCYIDDIIVTELENQSLRFDAYRGVNSFSVTCRLSTKSASASTVAGLVTKAKILEKETAFHLFKANLEENEIYSTAHELEAYKNETLKSKFGLFLNMNPSRQVLAGSRSHVAIFASFISDMDASDVQLTILTSDGRENASVVSPEDMILRIFEVLKHEVPICYSSLYSPLLPALLKINEQIVHKVLYSADPSDKFTNNTEGDALTFTQDHEKKKSFGTITTFRSYTSDYKDVESNQSRVSRSGTAKNETLGVEKSHKIEVKAPKAINSKNKGRINSKKRKSIIDVFKGLFEIKRSGKKEADIAGTVKISKPIVKRGTNERLPKKKAASQEVKDPLKQREHKTGGDRITSVIKHKEFASNEGIDIASQNTSKNEPNEHIRNNILKEQKSFESISRDPAEKSSKDRSIATAQDEDSTAQGPSGVAQATSLRESVHSILSQTLKLPETPESRKVGDCAAPNGVQIHSAGQNGFYRGQSRQSQLFNDDLYGELAVEAAKEKSSDSSAETVSGHNTKEVDAQKNHPDTTAPIQIIESPTIKQITPSEQIGSEKRISTVENFEVNISQYDGKETTEKNRIFPIIPTLDPPKLGFERSTSFVELFRGMRLILDENDAQYNWKRLSSESSLNEKQAFIAPIQNAHIFKTLAQDPDRRLGPPQEGNQIEMVKIPSSPTGKLSTEDSSGIPDLANDTSARKLNNSNQRVVLQNIPGLPLDDSESKLNTQPKPSFLAAPNFKVLRTSPTRIVNKLTKLHEVNRDSLNYDISLPLDLDMVSNKRWVELELPSQEDLQGDKFYTPAEQHNSEFPKEALEIDDHSTASEFAKEANETSQETSIEDSSKLIDAEDLLEDMEFSSFHMTFDASVSKDDISNYTSSPVQHDNNVNPQCPTTRHVRQEPVLYRLPKDIFSTSRTISQLNDGGIGERIGHGRNPSLDDDPIWVSPSKIDFYNLSKDSEESTMANRKAAALLEYPYDNKTYEHHNEDTNSLRELSYAYLASFVGSDQESERFDDKPVRLHFCD